MTDAGPGSGVVWITGYSGAGKTTVGRRVAKLLGEGGQKVILLDGDDLRTIFGGQWGYEKADRVELAHVYFRMCRHLASQGLVVVISAVAMFAEVRAWVHSHIPRSHVVFLDVPHEVRVRRDADTKRVYRAGRDIEGLYDEPTDDDVRIENFGGTSPDEAASVIVATFLARHSGPRVEL